MDLRKLSVKTVYLLLWSSVAPQELQTDRQADRLRAARLVHQWRQQSSSGAAVYLSLLLAVHRWPISLEAHEVERFKTSSSSELACSRSSGRSPKRGLVDWSMKFLHSLDENQEPHTVLIYPQSVKTFLRHLPG